jgi:hypothetical protein
MKVLIAGDSLMALRIVEAEILLTIIIGTPLTLRIASKNLLVRKKLSILR